MDTRRAAGGEIPTKEEAEMPATKLPAFEVDKAGLAKILERKGKSFAVIELIQNAWDEDTTHVDVTLEHLQADLYKLVVEDDNPEGFKDLAHAYTLFAESEKKDKATKRGRFNLGEKLVVAICDSAAISTTTGTIVFEGNSRHHTKDKRKRGSQFVGRIRMSEKDAEQIAMNVHTLIPPQHITTTYNHVEIAKRDPLKTFEWSLRTELADEDGRIKPTTRKTHVEVYEVKAGEEASLYEMGIPVVATGDRFHVNIGQKIPLPTDRDSVTPAYLRDVRVAVLNHTADILSQDDAKRAWVTNAMEDPKANKDALEATFAARFGEKVVIYDPTDPEANKIAAEQGYTVVPGGALSKPAWQNIKGFGIVLPAGQVTPSPNPNENADDLKIMDPAHYPKYVANVVEFAEDLAMRLLEVDRIEVRVANKASWPFAATYGPCAHGTSGLLTLNLGRLGHKWFEHPGAAVVDLLIHEFGHHYESDHLSRNYLDALTRLGAAAVMEALADPGFFAGYGIIPEGVPA